MKKNMWNNIKLTKFKASLIVLTMVLAFFLSTIQVANAMPVEDIPKFIYDKVSDLLKTNKDVLDKFYKKTGAKIVNTAISNAVNKVAMDAATYIATAGEGQKPTFVTEPIGTYVGNLVDSAAGDLIDGLGKWGSASSTFDLCKPADPSLIAKIGLGLVQSQRPSEPNCTATKLTTTWSTAFDKFTAMKSGEWVNGLKNSFDPTGSEIGASFELFSRVEKAKTDTADKTKTGLQISQGWLDVRGIDEKTAAPLGSDKLALEQATRMQSDKILKTTGESLVDAANIFLNQLAYQGFQRGLRELTKATTKTSAPYDFAALTNRLSSNAFEGLVQYGESIITEKLAVIVKPRFDEKADYNIISDLIVCNPATPGPNNCVIDDKFAQAISEKTTVGEALNLGYLHGDWLVTADNGKENTYNLRSASILRKFRIVPMAWEQAITAAAAKSYRVTFQDLVSCFDNKGKFSEDFNLNDKAWCQGLIDPNWVLKAPLNYCKKQGIGSQILVSTISSTDTASSSAVISRATDYCADEQTCIKEKADGSCDVYGYCNEEKRTWNFNSDACQPVYNTCQTFKNGSSQEAVSYLENTLDYSTCGASNSGCKQYLYNGVYSTSTQKIAWDSRYSIYLNNQAANCSASSEGCTQLIRSRSGWGNVNFIMNSDFSLNKIGDTPSSANWHWPVGSATATIANDGGATLSISGVSGAALYSNKDESLLPKNLTVIPGWSYTLSADIKINSGSQVKMTLGDGGAATVSTNVGSWQTISVTVDTSIQSTNNLDFKIEGSGTNVALSIKNLKLTPNNYKPDYTGYGANLAYEKLLPSYLESTCYNSAVGTGDYSLKTNAPDVCNNYALKCNRENVGCELFTATKDLFKVAAKANTNDYCDATCVGYDTYLARASYFYGTSADNLIPTTAKTCGAESVGCSSFTNLDAAGKGGENVEYYSKVRQCIKPDTVKCGDFYSWDNSQLKVTSLAKDANGDPYTVSDDKTLCSKEIYNLPVSNPGYNPDCREFYNKGGKITYHLYTNTVSCSDNCFAYRLNEKNIDKTVDQASCINRSDAHWDDAQSVCYVCQSGGRWDDKQNSCVYNVIPQEGTTCTAENVGCREYNGNNGNNLRLIATYNFDDDVNGFFGIDSSNALAQSSESTVKNGKSLSVATPGVRVVVSDLVTKNAAYVVKFMAKSVNPSSTLKVSMQNGAGDTAVFGNGGIAIKSDNQWHIYEVNLDNLGHDISGENLNFEVNKDILIDNIIVSEINDRYYLVKDSSVIPNECFYDSSFPAKYQGPNYNLGCAEYKDRAGVSNYLHQFSELCQDSAVGCEQMIQTNNSSDPYGYNVNLNTADPSVACTSGTPGCVEVKGHQAVYAIFDANKQCNVADLGCTRFGYSQTLGATTSWLDTYKKNLPDTYKSDTASPLCKSYEVGCDTWSSNGQNSYFKNPGVNTCVFKNNFWFKSPVKRCDINNDGKIADTEKTNAVCITNDDCGGKNCIADNNDYACDITFTKTFGFGGSGGKVATPSKSVGICTPEAATCSEYIDPVSKLTNNLVYNPTADDMDKDGSPDKWNKVASSNDYYYVQTVRVKANKLHVLEVTGPVVDKVTLEGTDTLSTLGKDNQLDPAATKIVTSTSSVVFYTGNNTSLNVYRFGTSTNDGTDKVSIAIREATINYQLSSNLEKATKDCNGVVNPDGGCILFNARTQVGRNGLNPLFSDASKTLAGSGPIPCNGVNCSANKVIKVTPDRVCSRWLSCQTYTEDPETKKPVCYAMGECDQLNDKNECGNFLPNDNTVIDSKTKHLYATGYSLLDNYYLGAMKEVGQTVSNANFDFEDEALAKKCTGNGSATCVVLEPQYSGVINYPAHGIGYLRVDKEKPIATIPISTNQDYYINYLVNTQGGDSGVTANLLVTTNGGSLLYTFADKGMNGWTRVVHKINVAGNIADGSIKIAVKPSGPSPVYFDDINIEPVLQVGPDKYAAKDCRLYPGADSLTCSSATNNVKKEGVFGYCLQYDSLNPGVCLMWYPVDKISPGSNLQSTKGYQGKFPLYYCTEADANFKFVKYIKPYVWKLETTGNRSYSLCDCNTNDGILFGSCVIRKDVEATDCGTCEPNYDTNSCNGDTNFTTIRVTGHFADEDGFIKYMCLPKASVIIAGKTSSPITGMNRCNNNNNAVEGWVEYKGTLVDYSYNKEDYSAAKKELCDDSANAFSPYHRFGDSTIWCGSIQRYQEAANHNPSIEIYDLNTKTLSTPDEYKIKCNSFVKLVKDDGTNMAWTDRVTSTSTNTITPSFFDQSYQTYGRLKEDSPFGSAILPGGYSLEGSEPIYLRKTPGDTAPLAGRPYSCTGLSCDHIGQHNNTNYCIFGNGDANINSADACEKLWSSPKTKTNALNTLGQIFNSEFGSYNLNSKGVYEAAATPTWSAAPGTYPAISNVKVKFSDNRVDNHGKFTVPFSGFYSLEFNTVVDINQQPLKQVSIDWGDGGRQIVTNIDDKPEKGNPHKFYHYYYKGDWTVKVKIIDNWDKYSTFNY